MKFIELYCGQLLNIDCIEYFDYQEYDKPKRIYSYVHLKNGSRFDFLEVPDEFIDENGNSNKFTLDLLITWHKLALEYILECPGLVIELDEYQDKSWDHLMKFIKTKHKLIYD